MRDELQDLHKSQLKNKTKKVGYIHDLLTIKIKLIVCWREDLHYVAKGHLNNFLNETILLIWFIKKKTYQKSAKF